MPGITRFAANLSDTPATRQKTQPRIFVQRETRMEWKELLVHQRETSRLVSHGKSQIRGAGSAPSPQSNPARGIPHTLARTPQDAATMRRAVLPTQGKSAFLFTVFW